MVEFFLCLVSERTMDLSIRPKKEYSKPHTQKKNHKLPRFHYLDYKKGELFREVQFMPILALFSTFYFHLKF